MRNLRIQKTMQSALQLTALSATLSILAACAHTDAAPSSATGGPTRHKAAELNEQQIPGERIIIGRVLDVTPDQLKVDTGETQPRVISTRPSKDKNIPIQQGDKLEIVLNDQNLVTDYYPYGDRTYRRMGNRVIRGEMAPSQPVGQEHVVIRSSDGRERPFAVRPWARNKVASIPAGVPTLFLVDENDFIADAGYHASGGSVERMTEESRMKNSLGDEYRVEGTVVQPLVSNTVLIRTSDGQKRQYAVRPIVQEKLAQLRSGDDVILLLDTDDKVTDVTVPRRVGERFGG